MHTNCKIREIPPAEWPAFADQFSRLHKGQRATVETFDPDLGTQANAQALPLMGLAAECSPDGGTEIEILLGDSGTPHSAYSMGRPSHVYVTEWNDAVSSALQIELEDGRVTVVRVGRRSRRCRPASSPTAPSGRRRLIRVAGRDDRAAMKNRRHCGTPVPIPPALMTRTSPPILRNIAERRAYYL